MEGLTRRQKEFLDALTELFERQGEPVHYSAVARRLSVGRVTAYEMLRLLESRGWVQAHYQRPEDRCPGRSPVVFRPVARPDPQTTQPIGSAGEWEQTKESILRRIEATKVGGYEPLMEELIRRLKGQHSPLSYLANMVTAILLGIHSVREEFEARGLRGIFRSIGLPGEGGLSALAGLAAGLSLVERFNKRLASALVEQLQKYQGMVSDLSADNRRRLAQFTQDVVDFLGS